MAKAKKQSNPIVKAFNKDSGERIKDKKNYAVYSKEGGQEYIQIYGPSKNIPFLAAPAGKKYKVPKGSYNTSSAEKTRTELRAVNAYRRKTTKPKPKDLYSKD